MNALTAAQQAQTCPSCTADPKAAPARYCPRYRCYCAHKACPAFAWHRPLAAQFTYLELLHPTNQRPERHP